MSSSTDPIQWVTDGATCNKCKEEPAVLIARREPYCGRCFIRFIRGKQRKPMTTDERYRVRYHAKPGLDPRNRVIIAASGGVLSLVLIDCVAGMLQDQAEAHQGRTGFELVVVTIEQEATDKEVVNSLRQLSQRFSTVSITLKKLRLDSYLDPATIHRLRITPEFAAVMGPNISTNTTLRHLLDMCVNKLSAEDLLEIVHHQLMLQTAVLEQCHTILYGHSLTRIASDIIALTVKGRGLGIHQTINNRKQIVSGEEIAVIFPLRDVLIAELKAYARVAELEDLVVLPQTPRLKITKNLTIRDLTANYFDQLEATGYSLTASAVVKIGDKLATPKGEPEGRCLVCGIDVYHTPKQWLQRITVETAAPLDTDEERQNYQAFQQATQTTELPEGQAVDLCYGCIVSLKGADPNMAWPVGERTLANRYDVDDVINELSLE